MFRLFVIAITLAAWSSWIVTFVLPVIVVFALAYTLELGLLARHLLRERAAVKKQLRPILLVLGLVLVRPSSP